MRQFQVPQFITVEDRVIGPFTAKQFLYLVAGAGVILLGRTILLSFLFIPFAALVGAFAAALAFMKINDQPFPQIVKNAIKYLYRPRLYVWKHETKPPKKIPLKAAGEAVISTTPRMSESKLSDLAWSLNIQEQLRQKEVEGQTKSSEDQF